MPMGVCGAWTEYAWRVRGRPKKAGQKRPPNRVAKGELLCFLKFIYLFLAALGLRCCVQAFSSCGEQRLLFVAVRGLLIAVARLVAEHGL